MRVYNLGSLNTEQVHHFHQPASKNGVPCGESLRIPGGKGYYQSIALARAGAPVSHVGFIGSDDDFIKQNLEYNGVDTQHVYKIEYNRPNKASMINALHLGTNPVTFDPNFLRSLFQTFSANDLILLQNEINDIPGIFELAKSFKLNITFHPSLVTPDIVNYPLELIDTLIFNLTTGAALTGEQEPEPMIQTLRKKYPHLALILTLGEKGAWYMDNAQRIKVPADPVYANDESQAGNTFVGYYLAYKLRQHPIESCLKIACRASALCVTRIGKCTTIPYLTEII